MTTLLAPNYFSISTFVPALEPNQPLIRRVQGAFSLGKMAGTWDWTLVLFSCSRMPSWHSLLYQGYLTLSIDNSECVTFPCCRPLDWYSVLFQARQGQRTSTVWFTATISVWNWKRSSITVGTSQSEGRQSWQQIWGSLRGRWVGNSR